MTESRDHKKTPAEVAKDVWKRTERARAAAEIPFVIWQAGPAPVPTRVQTDNPQQQRIEWQVQDQSEIERIQADHTDYARNRLQELQREAKHAGERPTRQPDRSRDRD